MVIVQVKDYGNNVALKRAQPPPGWTPRRDKIPKRKVGERAVQLRHILKVTANREVPETGVPIGQLGLKPVLPEVPKADPRPESPSPLSDPPLPDPPDEQPIPPPPEYAPPPLPDPKEATPSPDPPSPPPPKPPTPPPPDPETQKRVEAENWRASISKMMDEIRKVKQLPPVTSAVPPVRKTVSVPNLSISTVNPFQSR